MQLRFLFPSLLDATSSGILFTVLGVLAAVFVFFLVQYAQRLARSGGEFSANIHRIGTSDSKQIKLNLVVFNETKKDHSFSDPYLYKKNTKGETILLSKMVASPIGRNFKTMIQEQDGICTFPFPAGVRADLVLEFRIEEDFPPKDKIYLGGTNEKGKAVAALISLDPNQSETIAFRKKK